MIEKIKRYLQIKQLASYLGLQEPVTVTFLAQGEYNQNFVISDGIKKFVLRLNYGSQLQVENQIAYEYGALKWLERSHCTPKVYYLDDSQTFFTQGLLIMEFLAGEPLDYRTDLLVAAEIFGQIHGLEIDAAANQQFVAEKTDLLSARVRECARLLEPVFQSAVISSEVKRLLQQAWQRCDAACGQEKFFTNLGLWRVNNTEVNSHNFIIGAKNYLIDWEKPVISHPVQDISQFLATTTTLWRADLTLSTAEKQQFLQIYLAMTGFEPAEFFYALKLYHPYLMLRALAWSAMAFDSYTTGDKALQNEAIFQKVSTYLESDFLKQALREQVLPDD